METRRNLKCAVAAVMAGVLIGGGITTVTPAGAEVSHFAATHWKKIWKKKLQPQADKRYYAKTASDARYATKTDTGTALGNYYTKAQTDAALGGYYTKAQSDAAFQPRGNYAPSGSSYTKAESDARFAPAQPLYRGTYILVGVSTADGFATGASVSFGATFPAAPTVHYIKKGALVPAGCSGTSAEPNAAAGHFCVFEGSALNAAGNRGVCRGGGGSVCYAADPFGAGIYAFAEAPGQFEILGTWAARPGGPVVNPAFVPTAKGAVNTTESDQGEPATR